MGFFEEKSTFSRLIKYYAKRLKDPHAEGDLWGFLWLVMTEHPNKNDHYYAVCLRNEYVRLGREERKYKTLPLKCDILPIYEENYGDIFAFDMLRNLTEKQRLVLILRYFYLNSDDEISSKLGITRQATCRLRKRGLEKLAIDIV